MTISASTMTTVVAFLLSGASAHVVMNTPFGFPGLKVQSSPLGQNFQFPCQFGPSAKYDFSNSTKIPAGESTLLSFTGSAVHGGGSCQVAISTKPSADPKDWKVIHSMIGGCPATITQSTGNLEQIGTLNGYPQGKQCASPDSDETDCVKSYKITIPKDVPSGQYYFSWSWFNKVGNREMYQNCAPVEVTGSASSPDFLNTLPSMFVANVDGKPCTTTDTGPEKNVLDIPNPGTSVVRSTNPKDATNPDVLGSCKAVYDGAKAPDTPANGGTSASQAPAASSAAHAAISSMEPVVPSPTGTSVLSVTATTTLMTYVTVSKPSSDASSAPGIFAPQASAPAAPAAGCANPCPTDGALVCLPANSFGICDHGCAVSQPLAAGTTCNAGVISKRDLNPEDLIAHDKRNIVPVPPPSHSNAQVRHSQAHSKRRHGHARKWFH